MLICDFITPGIVFHILYIINPTPDSTFTIINDHMKEIID
jgi:hypothetical protein